MRYHHQSNAPPGSRYRHIRSNFTNTLFALLMLLVANGGRIHGQDRAFPESLDLPAYVPEVLVRIEPKDHPGFGRFTAPLGDINGDGYDDIAISTEADTTFIFLGGDPFDTEPDYFVLGGGDGITAGDFNGDGLVDLVTGWSRHGDRDIELRGRIRFFLNTGSEPPFRPEADRIIVGEPNEQIGYQQAGFRSSVKSTDMNGDGTADLLYPSKPTAPPYTGRMNIILGGANVLNQEPHQFLPYHLRYAAIFAHEYASEDLNGDGCDDLVIFGSDIDTLVNRSKRIQQLFVYLGNRDGVFGDPDIVNRSDSAWVPYHLGSDISDLDGDGCGELIDGGGGTLFGATLFFRGSPALSLHRSIWLSDSLPNPDPTFVIGAGLICPVGDINGDGYNDCIIGNAALGQMWGTMYLIYPAGPLNDWTAPIGKIPLISDREFLEDGAYPAGDVNGDGFEDIIYTGFPGNLNPGFSNRAWIYKGTPRLKTGIIQPSSAESTVLETWPQPLPVGHGLHVRLRENTTSPIFVQIHDFLGRALLPAEMELDASNTQISLPTESLPPGIYFLQARESRRIIDVQQITIY